MLAWAPAMVSGPFSSTFHTLAKTSSCLIFMNNFILGYTKNADNQCGFSKHYLQVQTISLTKPNADKEAIHKGRYGSCEDQFC